MGTPNFCLQMVRYVYDFERKAQALVVRLSSSPGLEVLKGAASPVLHSREEKLTV